MSWGDIASFGLILINYAIQEYKTFTDEEARAESLNNATFPRAEPGDAVALLYGTYRIEGPSVIYFHADTPLGPFANGTYQWPFTMRLLLCRCNERVDDLDPVHAQLRAVYIGDKRATLDGPNYQGANNGEDDTAGNSSYHLEEPSGNEFDGLIYGDFVIYDGRWTQMRRVDDKLYFGVDPPVAGRDVDVPYRGYVTMALYPWRVDSPQIPPISVVLYNPVRIPGYESSTGGIGHGDANPAAIIYDILNNPWGGVGNESTIIDTASFVEVAALLEDEQFGMSFLITEPSEARTVILEVCRAADLVLYQEMSTGKYVLRAMRQDDYNPLTIKTFDTSNIVEMSEMPTSLWSETFNQVEVEYRADHKAYRPATATAQDLASIAAMGRVRSRKFIYSGVTSSAVANTIANRELRFLSQPFRTLRFKANREAVSLRPGDAFRLSWAPWGYEGIFRVVAMDFGELASGAIEISAAADKWGSIGSVFNPPDFDEDFPVGEPPTTPDPIIDHLVTEAPRWIQVQAFDQGLINSPDVQRSYSLARPEGTDSRYRVDASISGADEEPDLGGRAFPATFTLAASYAYYQGPYDTTIGILVENLDGALTSATATEIREQGRNLIALWDDEGHHEILSFESAADLGGGTYQLENVSRGLLDTVPRTWAGGTPGAVLPGTGGVSAMGRLALRYGSAVTTHMPAASGSTWTPTSCSPTDSFTAASRTLRPVRGADLEIDGTQQPDDLEEGGVAITWKIRNRTTATIVRGDAASETAESGQTYDAVAYKGTGAQVVLVAGHTSGSTEVGLGKVGHGDIEVGVDTKRTVTLPDGSTPVMRGWQVPTIPFRAHHWRNLLINSDFAGYAGTGALDGWTAVSGTAAAANTLPPGSAGYYVRGATAGGTATIQQDVDVTGYPAHMLTAALTFLCRLLPDSTAPDDTVTVTLYGLDSGGATVASTTYGPASPATWTRQYLSLAALDVTVTTLRVRIVLTANGGGPADHTADAGVTKLCLRLGQQSSQLLTNPSFEDGGGGTTGWTAGSGTWQVIGTGAYEQTYYTRPNDGASAQLWQKVSLPTGHELAAGVLEFGRANDAADDTGEVLLEALDGGGAVLDSVTTGAEAIGGSLVWARRRLVLDPIPATATELRVTINATRVTGTPLNACFDDFDLRTHKHLDADQEVSATWDAPVVQYLPRTAMEWKFRFPTITGPDYAIYDGTPNGRLGIEPLLSVVGGTGARLNGKALAYDGTNLTTTAFEGYDTASGAYVATNPTGTAFCNFSSATSFTVLAFVRLRADAELADGFGICGRMADGVGWELRVTDADAYPMVRVTGDGGAASVTGTATIADGALHAVALVYTAGTHTLRLITTAGTSTASTAAIGELSTTVPGKFRVLWAGESEAATFGGQVLRVYVWRSAVATADVQAVMTYVETGDLTTQGRAGTGAGPLAGSVACVVGADATGVLVDFFPPDRPAIVLDDASDRYGLLSSPDAPNLATGATTASTGTVAENAAVDPTGHYRALRVDGTSGEGWALSGMTLGGAGNVYVRWMARASAAHHANAVLLNDSGAVVDTETVTLSTTWTVFDWAAAWDGSTAGVGGVRFAGSDDGTDQEIYLCPLVYVGLTPLYAGVFPIGDPGPTAPAMAITLTNQVNREGEVEIEVASLDADCTLVDLHNGTDDNDRRTISWDADAVTPIVASDHYNASGTVNSNAAISGTAIDPTAPWTARLRWNRAGTLDASTYITDVRAEQGATVEVDVGRNVVFTASTTAVDELELGHKADGSAVMAGVVFGVTVRAREEKVAPP